MDKGNLMNKHPPAPSFSGTQSSKTPDETNYASVILALVIAFATIGLYLIYKFRSSSRKAVLITGLCDSGKTLLYTRLVHNKFVHTQTSIKENVEDYIIKGKSMQMVDIPGHERLRRQFLDMYKTTTKGLIYVIDSQTIQKDIKDVAEFLYNILTDPVIYSNSPSILILCNKQDQPLVKNSKAIKILLEKEFNTLKTTKSNQLESLDGNVKNINILLGDEGKDFTFALMSQYEIHFVDAFVHSAGNNYNIVDVQKWLEEI